MPFDLHHSAAASFNARAAELSAQLEELPQREPVKPISSDVVAELISEKDIIGPIIESEVNYRGDTVGRTLWHTGKRFSLQGNNYKRLRDLSVSICDIRSFGDRLSHEYVEEHLFEWICENFKTGTPTSTPCDALIEAAIRDTATLETWVPIANLEIAHSFVIASGALHPMSAAIVNQWEQKSCAGAKEHAPTINAAFNDVRKKFQGRAAFVMTIEAEPKKRFEIAVERAQMATSLISIFSPAAFMPDVMCISAVSGTTKELYATAISASDRGTQIQRSVLDRGGGTWRLTARSISEIRSSGLEAMSNLLRTERQTEFGRQILSALLIYSKAMFTAQPVEKAVYILSSLESLLLKDHNESIQQNLGERIAFFLEKEPQARRNAIAIIKGAYAIRSRYLHHGRDQGELKAIKELLLLAWRFYVNVVRLSDRHKNRFAFIDAVENVKLS